MAKILSAGEEIKIIRKFFKGYNIKADVVEQMCVPIKGAYMSYFIKLQDGGTIDSVVNRSGELSLRISEARMKETNVRVRRMPLMIEVPSQAPQPLEVAQSALDLLEPFQMLYGQKVGFGGVEAMLLDLRNMEHGLVAGTTGSGKSSLLKAMLRTLTWSTSPKQVNLVLMDPKNADLHQYDDMPHTIGKAYNRDDIELLCNAVYRENQRRQALPDNEVEKLPRIVAIVDEWAEMISCKSFIEQMASIMQTGRSAGIHVLACTPATAGQHDRQHGPRPTHIPLGRSSS